MTLLDVVIVMIMMVFDFIFGGTKECEYEGEADGMNKKLPG